jgi:hypothetical protein
MSATARLGIPLISPGQAQKEMFHNEAIQTLEALVAPSVEEPPRVSPPASPALGSCYIIAAGATGAWSGKQDNLACFTAGGWRFVGPLPGMTAYVRSTSVWAVYRSSAWELGVLRGSALNVGGQQVVGARGAAIPSPTGGSVVDTEGRAAISAILAALRSHGLIAP